MKPAPRKPCVGPDSTMAAAFLERAPVVDPKDFSAVGEATRLPALRNDCSLRRLVLSMGAVNDC
ncbi:hypothetical protein CHELA40_50241 [Chelatococcus asaccharovorans]|nr:hypothetical protein CHELA17_20205 [Chelatococcus asaccharovorans]CAH1691897.1 hypothetical protein CHELA40_50241 [Chelatococcus asaccharovorans]